MRRTNRLDNLLHEARLMMGRPTPGDIRSLSPEELWHFIHGDDWENQPDAVREAVIYSLTDQQLITLIRECEAAIELEKAGEAEDV
jgi:hypothetical protein